jgi:hypothetical protein
MSTPVPDGPLAPVIRLDDFRSQDAPEPPADPAAVWAEVMNAARLFGTLREAGMSVRFETEEEGPPRVVITDLEGRTIKEIPPSAACDPDALEDAAFNQGG